jgi:hypothetical protein
MVPSSGITGPAPADAYLRQSGFTPSPISPPWDAQAELNVVIAADVPWELNSGFLAFFFAGGKYVGRDSQGPSNDVFAIRVSSTEIKLRYSLYDGPGNSYTGKTADVRFGLADGVLVALDPMPNQGLRT